MQSAEGGRDEALAESGYGAPLVLGEPNVEGEPLGNVSPSRVLVLSPVAEHPSPESLKRLEHAYSFKEELDPAWAARPIDLARHRDRMVLVLADPGGKPLDQFGGFGETRPTGPPAHALDLGLCLRIGINLANAIGHLHRRGIVHKDIKPANVLVNLATDLVWLMGFGIASRLPRERQSPDFPEFLEGTLAYMAPEQTGRMNRSIDSRSDLYSLGITLYEMVTGSLPFTASDPMEWVHCHIARKPVPPSERLKAVPLAVSAIILKMLAKTAEERYLTAAGVESDLRRCLADWQTRGRIDEFPLGVHDTPDRLLIPEKLYGRRREINDLLASFERVVASGRPELVLVSGYSGIGKSSVVNELHKVLVEPRGLFASGKFDQYKRDIPYATPAQAFQGLIRSLLGKSDAELSHGEMLFERRWIRTDSSSSTWSPSWSSSLASSGRFQSLRHKTRNGGSSSSYAASSASSQGPSIRWRSFSTTCSGSTRPRSICSRIC
jgi:serine/threonine protein kinase